MEGILGITGTPGTGKKSIAPLVAQILGVKALGLNDFARTHGLLEETGDESEVDVHKLRGDLEGAISEPVVMYGHLIPYVLSRGSVSRVVVLRCEPAVLGERLKTRGYSRSKLVDNVEAELIGLVSSDAYEAFGEEKTFELDTTSSNPVEAAKSAADTLRKGSTNSSRIDWTLDYDSGPKLRSLLSGE